MPTLDWIGKQAVVNHHRHVPFRLLHCDPRNSAGDPDSGNLLVQGDNLEALKALLPYYAGKVKCIYIDPPYNTGNENWIYNDNVNSPQIKKWLGQVVGKEAEDLTRHDKWLCMMYPRLALLREFLSEDGAIVIHIDEHEASSLQILLDELFGKQNFLGAAAWDKGNPKGDSKGIAYQHETVMFYSRHRTTFEMMHGPILEEKPNAVRMIEKAKSICARIGKVRLPDDFAEFAKAFDLPEECVAPYKRKYTVENVRAEFARWVKSEPTLTGGEQQYFRLRWNEKHGAYRVYRLASMAWPNKQRAPDEYFEPLKHDKTGEDCPVPARGWRFPPATMRAMIEADLIEFGDDCSVQPQQRLYLDEYLSQRFTSVFKDARSTDALFASMNIVFENAKPHELAMRLIKSICADEHDLILDSFAGSGTTGHAVLQMNKADGGHRRFICIEMDETIARDVTSQRLKKVVEGYTNAKGDAVEPLGGGFRFCTLGRPLFDEFGNIDPEVKFKDLAAHVFFSETGSPLPKGTNKQSPLLGVFDGRAVYLLYNGILGDKKPQGGNVLTSAVLASLPPHYGPKVVYGEACRLGEARLKSADVTFKQVPWEVRIG